jgi:tRNA modification GTPase
MRRVVAGRWSLVADRHKILVQKVSESSYIIPYIIHHTSYIIPVPAAYSIRIRHLKLKSPMAHRVKAGWLLLFVMARIMGSLLFPCSGRVFAWCRPRYHRRQTTIAPVRGLFATAPLSDSRRPVEIEPDSKSNDFPTPLDEQDTIYALSSGFTGQQATALAVIRISGPQAHDVLTALTPTRPLPKPRVAALRKLAFENQMLDHALVLRFDGPNSFTGEDLIELQCHGSRAVVQGLLDTLPKIHGCRYAQAGEFTQRAYANGKLDLVQVEALADVLTADTQAQLAQALSQLDGRLSQRYDEWRQELIKGLAHAEAVIDFGDDEQLGMDDVFDDDEGEAAQWNVWGDVRDRMQNLQHSMQDHLQDDRRGELLREGVKIAIVGPPNAGKSSLFNVLAQQDAAIVSEIAGTTRDVLTLSLDLSGVKCTLQDTAGVRTETTDVLELEGIRRAQAVAEKADLVVAMVDATEAKLGLDIVQQVLKRKDLEAQRVMLVLNKLDLVDEKAATTTLEDQAGFEFGGTHEISCVTQQGIDKFLEALKEQVVARTTNQDDNAAEGAMITRARHRQHVEGASEALERFVILSGQGTMAVDMAAEELRLASSELGRITGAVDVEDVLDVLFTDFCIGK